MGKLLYGGVSVLAILFAQIETSYAVPEGTSALADQVSEAGSGYFVPGQRGANFSRATTAVADGDKTKLEIWIKKEGAPDGADSGENQDSITVDTAPVVYDPDEDPAFQKALRQYLSDQGIDRPFNPDAIAQSKSQTFGLQNPCTNRTGAVLDDCLAERVCTTDEGGDGVYMNVVVRQGDGPNTPWGEPMCVAAAEAEGGEEILELPTFTLQDFRTLAVAPAASTVQPAPDTLKGMHTNVYAEAQPQQFATELGGFPVQVRAVPVQYAWD